MFERGDFAVVCKCSNIGEHSAIASLIHKCYYEFIQNGEREFNFKIRG